MPVRKLRSRDPVLLLGMEGSEHIGDLALDTSRTVSRMGTDPADDLVNAAVFVPKGERFTAFWDQDEDMQIDRPHELTSIDHVLILQGLEGQLDAVEIDHNLSPALGTDGFVSDHFPIVVRFDLEGPIPQPDVSVRLALLLPNPPGDESQDEEATLANDGTQAVSLTGWTLRDRAGRSWVLGQLRSAMADSLAALAKAGPD